MFWNDYIRVRSEEDAVKELSRLGGGGRVIAGGTDLVLQLKDGSVESKCLIDVSKIESMRGMYQKDGKITVGAANTHGEISHSDLVRRTGPILSEACAEIGSRQIRNIATIGGNIVNALPAADSVIPLIALNASCRVVSSDASREIPIEELFLGPGVSTVDPTNSLLTQISFEPLDRSEGSGFYRLTRRKGATCPIINCAIWLRWDEEIRRIKNIRIAMGPVAPVPKRLRETEAVLMSTTLSERLIKEAQSSVEKEVVLRSSIRGGSEYRSAMSKVIFKRTLGIALKNAGWENGC
ncbi:MAG: FAD binding domain-containing protein [Thermodesulfobacteriota bacterium]